MIQSQNQNNLNQKLKEKKEKTKIKYISKDSTNEDLIINKIYTYSTKNIAPIKSKNINNSSNSISNKVNENKSFSRRNIKKLNSKNSNIMMDESSNNENNIINEKYLFKRQIKKNQKRDKIRLIKYNNNTLLLNLVCDFEL